MPQATLGFRPLFSCAMFIPQNHAMGTFDEDIKKVVSMLEYYAQAIGTDKVIITQWLFEKFQITEPEFRVALKQLVRDENSIKIVYEFADGHPLNDDNEIEFFEIELPKDFFEVIVPKYTLSKLKTKKKKLNSKYVKYEGHGITVYNDYTVKFESAQFKLRNQTGNMLGMLITKKIGEMLTTDEVKEELISSSKRADYKDIQIKKYFSEINTTFEQNCNRKIIGNSNKEGWYLALE